MSHASRRDLLSVLEPWAAPHVVVGALAPVAGAGSAVGPATGAEAKSR